jgi:hypothetical protein
MAAMKGWGERAVGRTTCGDAAAAVVVGSTTLVPPMPSVSAERVKVEPR